jgi:hypothetical protein
MTLKENWADGQIVHASDINDITKVINDVALITTTETKIEAYTANGGELVPCNASGGSFVVTLPTGVTDGTRVIVKKIDSSLNAITVACQGSDRLEKTGGATTISIPGISQAITFQYRAYSAIWYLISGNITGTYIGQSLVTAPDAAAIRTLIETISSTDSRLTDTRTPTDASVTLAKLSPTLSTTLVTLTGNQTLTGKTITSGKFNSVCDVNGNTILGLNYQATPTSYLSVSNTSDGSAPALSASSSTLTNVGISLSPQGAGVVSISVPSGQGTATISGTGAGSVVDLNLTSKGSGSTIKANGVEVVTLSGNQTLIGKIISGSSNTFSNIPASAIVNQPPGPSVSSTDYETIGTPNKVSIGSIANIDNGNNQSTLVLPSINNDLNYHFMRGGDIKITKNGVTATVADYTADIDNAFSPRSQHWFLNPASTSDIFVIEISHPYVTFTTPTAYGIDMRAAQSARNVSIDVWNSVTSAWVSVGSITNNVTGSYAKATSLTSARTKIRYTLTNFVTTQCRINALFATTPQGLNTEAFLPRNGGTLYGTTALGPTITAGGSDPNINLNLVSKGTGVVRANGVEVVTTGGLQTLTNKTIAGYLAVTPGQPIPAQYLPVSSYVQDITSGTSTSSGYVVTINHNLAADVTISVWEKSTGAEVNCDKIRSSINQIRLVFATAPTSGSLRVLVLSNGSLGPGTGGGSSGTSSWGVFTITGPENLAATDNFIYIYLLGSGASPTLPTAIGNKSIYVMKNTSSSGCAIKTSAGQTVEGQSNMVLSSGASVELVSDSTNWVII